MTTSSEELARFLRGERDPADFHHRDHVRLAFQLLTETTFPEATAAYARGVRGMAARAGRPEAYHETITVAFLALVAERQARSRELDFEAFASANTDLLEKGVLRRWYDDERLASPLARRVFLLPAPALPSPQLSRPRGGSV